MKAWSCRAAAPGDLAESRLGRHFLLVPLKETPISWVGLDLHKTYITACALDEADGVVAEHRRLPADAEALVSWLTGLGGPVTVATLSTGPGSMTSSVPQDWPRWPLIPIR